MCGGANIWGEEQRCQPSTHALTMQRRPPQNPDSETPSPSIFRRPRPNLIPSASTPLGVPTVKYFAPGSLPATCSTARKAAQTPPRQPTCLMCVSRPFWCMATTQICKKCARRTGPSDPPAASAAIAAGPPAPGANSGTLTHPRGSCSSFTWCRARIEKRWTVVGQGEGRGG